VGSRLDHQPLLRKGDDTPPLKGVLPERAAEIEPNWGGNHKLLENCTCEKQKRYLTLCILFCLVWEETWLLVTAALGQTVHSDITCVLLGISITTRGSCNTPSHFTLQKRKLCTAP